MLLPRIPSGSDPRVLLKVLDEVKAGRLRRVDPKAKPVVDWLYAGGYITKDGKPRVVKMLERSVQIDFDPIGLTKRGERLAEYIRRDLGGS